MAGGSRSGAVAGAAVAALVLLLGCLASVAVAKPVHPGARKAGSHGCKGKRMQLRIGHRSTCIPVSRPATSAAAAQRRFDKALLAARLIPRQRHAKGSTLGGLMGPARAGLAAVAGALAHPGGASASASGWGTRVQEVKPKDAEEHGSTIDILARRGKATVRLKIRDTVKFQNCPDAAGEVPGERTKTMTLKISVPLSGGRKLVVESSQETTAPFVGTTDDQAALAELTIGRIQMSASASGELLDSKGNVIAVLPPEALKANAVMPPLGPEVGWPGVLADPDTALIASSALDEALHGGTSSLDPLLRGFVVAMQNDIWRTYELVHRALVAQQLAWWQGGRCVRVDLQSVGSMPVAGGAQDTLTAAVVLTNAPPHPDNSGTASFQLSAGSSGGSVSPASTRTAAADSGHSNPVSFVFSAPNLTSTPIVTVTASSPQGIASSTLPIQVVGLAAGYKYRVTMHGSGHFEEEDSMYDSSSTTHWHYNTTMESIDATWDTVFVPASAPPFLEEQGASSFTLLARAEQHGTYTLGSSFDDLTCTGNLGTVGDPSQEGVLKTATPGPNGDSVTVKAFAWMQPEPNPSCSRSGNDEFFEEEANPWGSFGGEDIRLLGGDEGSFLITPGDFAASSFTVHVSGPPFPSECGNTPGSGGGTTFGCTHSLAWNADLTFTKLATCSVIQGGWACKE